MQKAAVELKGKDLAAVFSASVESLLGGGIAEPLWLGGDTATDMRLLLLLEGLRGSGRIGAYRFCCPSEIAAVSLGDRTCPG